MIKKLLKLDVRWYVAIAIILMALLAVRNEGAIVLRHAIPICLIACILDFIIVTLRDRKSAFPISALVSGLIISAVLAPTRLFYIAPVFAVLSKHIIKVAHRHIFNPAGFGLFIANVFFGLSLSWWLTENVLIVLIFGLFLGWKLRKFSLIFSFTTTTILLSIVYSLFKHQPALTHLHIISPFFIFFMLPEPKTSPGALKNKLIYGGVASLCVIISFALLPRYDFLILGLIIGNIFGVSLRKVR